MVTVLPAGRLWGIPLRLHGSWFVILSLLAATLGTGYFPGQLPGAPVLRLGLLALAASLLFFGSVLLYELSHAWVARSFELRVSGIMS